jgi:hypothetical protein
MTTITDERLTDADWLEEAARYFEKRPTSGEDMAFWANVANAERCRSIAATLRASLGVEPVGWVTAEILAAMKRGDPAMPGWKQSGDFRIPLYASPLPTVEVTEEKPPAWVADYRKSDGTTDYFVMIGRDGRETSLHMHRIRGRAEYEAAEINHALTGSKKPEFDEFDVDGDALSQNKGEE